MCEVGEGEISRHFSLLSLSYASKELLSDMMTSGSEILDVVEFPFCTR